MQKEDEGLPSLVLANNGDSHSILRSYSASKRDFFHIIDKVIVVEICKGRQRGGRPLRPPLLVTRQTLLGHHNFSRGNDRYGLVWWVFFFPLLSLSAHLPGVKFMFKLNLYHLPSKRYNFLCGMTALIFQRRRKKGPFVSPIISAPCGAGVQY